MSGGSYDYLYQKMQDGGLDAFASEADRLADSINDTAHRLRSGEVSTWSRDRPDWFAYPDADTTAWEADRIATLVRHLRGCIEELHRDIKQLADIARAVEWRESGDWGHDAVADAVREASNLPPVRST